jgi:putative addiction module component (TIGR02574 family)
MRGGEIKFPGMSKVEILAELPKLEMAERREILERICEMEDRDLLEGTEPEPGEKALLDRELEIYHADPNTGSTWTEVESRLREQKHP